MTALGRCAKCGCYGRWAIRKLTCGWKYLVCPRCDAADEWSKEHTPEKTGGTA